MGGRMTAQLSFESELTKGRRARDMAAEKRPGNRMNAADLKTSVRLQRVSEYLSDRQWHSTRDIIQNTGMCAINSIIAELRVNGLSIECKFQGKTGEGNSIYKYKWNI
jgi:hypothetical protein